jgi:hypothetical protein
MKQRTTRNKIHHWCWSINWNIQQGKPGIETAWSKTLAQLLSVNTLSDWKGGKTPKWVYHLFKMMEIGKCSDKFIIQQKMNKSNPDVVTFKDLIEQQETRQVQRNDRGQFNVFFYIQPCKWLKKIQFNKSGSHSILNSVSAIASIICWLIFIWTSVRQDVQNKSRNSLKTLAQFQIGYKVW